MYTSTINKQTNRPEVTDILHDPARFPEKSGIFKLRELCAYLELHNVLGHYEYVLLEICRLPRFFPEVHEGRVPLSGAGLGGKLQKSTSTYKNLGGKPANLMDFQHNAITRKNIRYLFETKRF